MNLKKLIKDDGAVSPVIGVILMVAITVILAAVIASFVLGLGDSADEVQPNTSIEFDYDAGGDNITIRVTDGESIEAQNLYVRGSTSTGNSSSIDTSWDTAAGSSDTVGVTGGNGFDPADEVASGQGIIIDGSNAFGQDVYKDYELSVVWETDSDSATLQSDTGPDV